MPPALSELFEDSPGEFFMSVEVFVTTIANGTTLPKTSTKAKKLEKRESVGDDLKAKDKTSTSTQKAICDTGHWKSAICRLTEDKERCVLSIYVDDESIAHQTIPIHLINQTDIRPTEQSLFYRKDCISITPRTGQTSNTTHLAFPSPETCATWQALLKSYAIPETYGQNLVPLEGGYYRLWRQVDLTVIQGRNLGTSNGRATRSNLNQERSEVDVSCEIHLNDIICGRTTVKNGGELIDWHESFSYPGLPPFEILEVVVWKDRKSSKPVKLGSTCIMLCNFRRGEFVEGWFPVVRRVEGLGVENHMGDLRLKVRVDEEVILPSSCYVGLLATCQSRNFIAWISDLENRLKLKDISLHFMSIAICNNTAVDQIQKYVASEVENSPTSHQTLFRGNTNLTKVVELSMTWYGMSFLEASIGPVLRRLCSDEVVIEVDPTRTTRGPKDVEKNVEQLVYWCQEFWNQIYSVRTECPNDLKRIFKTIFKEVEQRKDADPISGNTQSNLPSQCISAFIFLRFIVPAILHPHLFGLFPGLLSVPVQRSLTLVAKVIQSLANLNMNSHKEHFMRGVQEFLKVNFDGMIDYISVVSTPSREAKPDDRRRHIRRVRNDLRQRTRTMAALQRESIPALPHLLDIPRHLACISSAVVRRSKEPTARVPLGDNADEAIDQFCAKCLEIEDEAFSRVNRILTKVGSAASDGLPISIPNSLRKGNEVHDTPVTPSQSQGGKRLTSRPATAAGCKSHQTSMDEDEHTKIDESLLVSNEGHHHLNVHTKSRSTDSLPKMMHDTRTLPPPPPPTAEKEGDSSKWRKALFRSILKR